MSKRLASFEEAICGQPTYRLIRTMTEDGPLYSFALMDAEYDPVVVVFDTTEPGDPTCAIIAGPHQWLSFSPDDLETIAAMASAADEKRRQWEGTQAGRLYSRFIGEDDTCDGGKAREKYMSLVRKEIERDKDRASRLCEMAGWSVP